MSRRNPSPGASSTASRRTVSPMPRMIMVLLMAAAPALVPATSKPSRWWRSFSRSPNRVPAIMLVARSWSPPVRSTAVLRSSMSISSSESASRRLLSGERNTSPTPGFSRSFRNASSERSGSAEAAAQTRILDYAPPASSTSRGRMRMSRSSISSLPPIRRRRPRRRRDAPAVMEASASRPERPELLQHSRHVIGQNDHQVAITDLLDCTGNGLGLAVHRLDSIGPDPHFRQTLSDNASDLTPLTPAKIGVLLEDDVIQASRAPTHASQIFVPAIARCGDHANATLGRHAPYQIHESLDRSGIVSVVHQDLALTNPEQVEPSRSEGR